MSLTVEIKPFPISADAQEFLNRLSTSRAELIAKVVEGARIADPVEAMYAAAVVDIEMSPRSTNLAMLSMIGCDVKRPADGATDDEIDDVIALVVSGLAAWNVYLIGSNAFDSRKLVEILFDNVLVDEVKMIPPSIGVVEIIDLNDKGLDETHDRDKFFPKPPVRIDSAGAQW